MNPTSRESISPVYVSTGGYSARTATETTKTFIEHKINFVELSGGKYDPNVEKNLRELAGQVKFKIHNYFPPPEKPFVFNLASLNSTIARLSIEHVRKSMELASSIGGGVYSFHAGFLIDPEVNELGRRINKKNVADRKIALDAFIERVCDLAKEANTMGLELLIENNVLSKTNLATFGKDPLLFTEPEEINQAMEMLPGNVNLLLDVAHLKVSAASLGFDLIDAHADLLPHIKAYHLSENDGFADTNDPFNKDSWFWNCIKTDLNYYSVEVYRTKPSVLKALQAMVENILDKS